MTMTRPLHSAVNHSPEPLRLRQTDPSGIRVVVVDDNRLYREAIANLLREKPWVSAVQTAGDGNGAIVHDVSFPPTVTLLNMATHESHRVLCELTEAQAAVVVLGVREIAQDLVPCAESGSAGYLLRSDPLESLGDVIQAVARGESICSPKTTAVLLRRVAQLAAERRARHGLGQLTARESEILDLIAEGMANCDIAKALHIEVRTVKNHVHAILRKLGVERRGQAAARVHAIRSSAAGI